MNIDLDNPTPKNQNEHMATKKYSNYGKDLTHIGPRVLFLFYYFFLVTGGVIWKP